MTLYMLVERMRSFRTTAAAHPPAEAVEQLMASVEQWSTTQQDDLTLLICDSMGANADSALR